MEDQSQTPVTKEMWYSAQKFQADMLKEFKRDTGESLNRIEIQTTQHNGRLKKVELRQSFIQGGMAVVAILLVPILIFVAQTYFQCNRNCTAEALQVVLK